MPNDREVAGMRCMQVLEVLSDYLDDLLSAERKLQINEHLLGCNWCESFGGRFADMVQQIRREMAQADQAPRAMVERLYSKLKF